MRRAPSPPSLGPARAEQLAERLKALADPTRLRMLDLLVQHAQGGRSGDDSLPAHQQSTEPPCVCDVTTGIPHVRAASTYSTNDRLAADLPPAEPLCVCEITALFPQNQPTISHHLKVLREAGLIAGEKRGVWSYYWATAAGREALAMVQRLG